MKLNNLSKKVLNVLIQMKQKFEKIELHLRKPYENKSPKMKALVSWNHLSENEKKPLEHGKNHSSNQNLKGQLSYKL